MQTCWDKDWWTLNILFSSVLQKLSVFHLFSRPPPPGHVTRTACSCDEAHIKLCKDRLLPLYTHTTRAPERNTQDHKSFTHTLHTRANIRPALAWRTNPQRHVEVERERERERERRDTQRQLDSKALSSLR